MSYGGNKQTHTQTDSRALIYGVNSLSISTSNDVKEFSDPIGEMVDFELVKRNSYSENPGCEIFIEFYGKYILEGELEGSELEDSDYEESESDSSYYGNSEYGNSDYEDSDW